MHNLFLIMHDCAAKQVGSRSASIVCCARKRDFMQFRTRSCVGCAAELNNWFTNSRSYRVSVSLTSVPDVTVLLAVFNAAAICPTMVALFPEHTRRHYTYLRSSMPELVPPIQVVFRGLKVKEVLTAI